MQNEAQHHPQIDKPKKEVEAKILDFDTFKNLESMLRLVRADLTEPKRLISDSVFKYDKKLQNEGEERGSMATIQPDLIFQEDLPEFVKALEYLGFKVIQDGPGSDLKIEGMVTKNANVRIRVDGDQAYLTVKGEKIEKQGIKSSDEIEPKINDPKAVKKLLKQLDFKKTESRQKYRTTWESNYKGERIKIELNESPRSVPNSNSEAKMQWLEIEGPDNHTIIQFAQLMGFNKKDLSPLSDKKMYLRAGFSKEQIANMTFDKNA